VAILCIAYPLRQSNRKRIAHEDERPVTEGDFHLSLWRLSFGATVVGKFRSTDGVAHLAQGMDLFCGRANMISSEARASAPIFADAFPQRPLLA
jgi:hypothetical protein